MRQPNEHLQDILEARVTGEKTRRTCWSPDAIIRVARDPGILV